LGAPAGRRKGACGPAGTAGKSGGERENGREWAWTAWGRRVRSGATGWLAGVGEEGEPPCLHLTSPGRLAGAGEGGAVGGRERGGREEREWGGREEKEKNNMTCGPR